MRTLDKVGYFCLAVALTLYYFDHMDSGRFINAMAMGFFLRSMYEQYQEMKAKKNGGK